MCLLFIINELGRQNRKKNAQNAYRIAALYGGLSLKLKAFYFKEASLTDHPMFWGDLM